MAAGWDGATVEERRLRPVLDGDVLRLHDDETGRAVRVVTGVDGEAFGELWLRRVAQATDREGSAS